MIYTGIDIIEIDRIVRVKNIYKERFLKKIYTLNEIKYCRNRGPQLASRFAAKEAIMKALKSSGVDDPISFESIEILSSKTGEPIVVIDIKFSGQCKVSISHTNSHAIASAIYTLE